MKWIIVLLVGETINKELTPSGLLLEEKVAITQISKHAPKNLQSINVLDPENNFLIYFQL